MALKHLVTVLLALGIAACTTAPSISPTMAPTPTPTLGPQDIVAAFVSLTADAERSFSMELEGELSAGGFGGVVSSSYSIDGGDYLGTALIAGFTQEIVSVAGTTWARINGERWTTGNGVALPDPFAGLSVDDLVYLGTREGLHRLEVTDVRAAFERVWHSDLLAQADISRSSFEIVVDGSGRPTRADLVIDGDLTGPPGGPLSIEFHFTFTDWGKAFAIALPAELIPTPAPTAFVPPVGTVPAALPGRLAWSSWWGGPAYALVVVNPDGGGGKAWGEPSTERNYEGAEPAFSPDGQRIAFSRVACEMAKSGEACPRVIAIITEDGIETDVTLPDGGSQDHHPAWSPDGERIMFDSNRATSSEDVLASALFVVDAAGGAVSRVDTGMIESRSPAWSPDGTRILFSGSNGFDAEVRVAGLFVAAADGSGPTQVTSGNGGGGGRPGWSPDGSRIGWSRYTWDGHERLVVVNADGSNLLEMIEGSFQSWSPDGRYLLYVSGGGDSMWVVRADGAGARRLPFDDRGVAWGVTWAPFALP